MRGEEQNATSGTTSAVSEVEPFDSIEALVDIDLLKNILDKFSAITGLAVGLVAHPDNKILIEMGLKDLCLLFHRKSPESRDLCHKSQQLMAEQMTQPGKLRFRRCALGLVDSAVPIVIADRHVASLFAGQLFLEEPNVEGFSEQARLYGYDPKAYLDALAEIPVISEQRFNEVLSVLSETATMIANMGLNALRARQKDRELQAREFLLADVFESVQDGISVLDTDLTILRVNGLMRSWYAENMPLEGKKCFECYHNADKPCDPCPTLRCLESGKTEREIVRGLAGSPVEWIELYSYPMKDSVTGKVTGVVEFVRDITSKNQAEEELGRLRDLLGQTINYMPSVLVGMGGDGRVTQWNLEAEKVTGVTAKAAQGRALDEVYPALSGQMERVRHAISTGETQRQGKVSLQVDGENRLADITVYPLVSDSVDGAVIRIDDVTDRTHLEEMIIQSEKMLSLGGLAAGMAHEINNPLAGVMNSMEVMRNRLRTNLKKNQEVARDCGTSIEAIWTYMEQRGILSMIETTVESSQRMADIISNVLDFSRKGEGVFAAHDIGLLLDKTVELASSEYDPLGEYDFRKITIERKYSDDRPKVWCAASQIQQVFFNLLKNGAQAMAHNNNPGKAPCFKLRIIPEQDDLVRVEIEDNGSGMKEAIRKRVFEPFFSTKEVGVGTGLGLSLAYFIITENHGGSMAVESSPDKGTKFIIRLPAERSFP